MMDAMKATRRMLLGILVLAIAGTWWLLDVVAELEFVYPFKVEELPGEGPIRLRISGAVSSNLLRARKITTKIHGSAIVVLLYAVPGSLRPGTTGQIDYELPIPDSVTEVRFGNNAKVIWTRGSSLRSR